MPNMNPPWPGGWRYALGASGGWLLFIAAILSVGYVRALGGTQATLTALALAPALIAAIQYFVAWRLVAEQDEFVRGLFAKRMLAAGAIAGVLAIRWSGGEMVGAPPLPAWLLYPLVWGLFGAMTPFIGGTRS